NNTVAIKTNGSLWVWGSNVQACLGVGATPNSAVYVPTRVGTDTNWAQAIAVQHMIIAIKKDGSLWSWGRKGYSDVRGYAATTDVTPTPTRIGTDNDWKRVFVHEYHGNASAIAQKADGSWWVWGNNSKGKLGLGDEAPRTTPTPFKPPVPMAAFAVGRFYTIAVAANGSLWHSGEYLQWFYTTIGQPSQSNRFVRMPFSGRFTGAYFFKSNNTLLVDEGGNLYVYGLNAYGEHGNGTKTSNWTPQKIILPPAQ
ncbi:MAG TPA: hypothetical protein PKD90_13070, partial [Phnomibacter sp.]|nr:hypothetical protein [Phnomibacter sp.]